MEGTSNSTLMNQTTPLPQVDLPQQTEVKQELKADKFWDPKAPSDFEASLDQNVWFHTEF